MTQKEGMLSTEEILDALKDIRQAKNDPKLRILKKAIEERIENKLHKQNKINTSSEISPNRLAPK